MYKASTWTAAQTQRVPERLRPKFAMQMFFCLGRATEFQLKSNMQMFLCLELAHKSKGVVMSGGWRRYTETERSRYRVVQS